MGLEKKGIQDISKEEFNEIEVRRCGLLVAIAVSVHALISLLVGYEKFSSHAWWIYLAASIDTFKFVRFKVWSYFVFWCIVILLVCLEAVRNGRPWWVAFATPILALAVMAYFLRKWSSAE